MIRLNILIGRPVRSNAIATSTEGLNHAGINVRNVFARKYPPQSTARYSLVQLRELEQCGVNEFVKVWRGDSNPDLH